MSAVSPTDPAQLALPKIPVIVISSLGIIVPVKPPAALKMTSNTPSLNGTSGLTSGMLRVSKNVSKFVAVNVQVWTRGKLSSQSGI